MKLIGYKSLKTVAISTIAALMMTGCGPASQPASKAAPTKQTHKMTTPIPPGIAIPDSVDTRLGTLKFFDGFPDDATVEKLYDNLDFQRAVQAYLLAIPAVNQAAMRKALLQWGPANTTMPIWEDLVFPRTVGLTFNTSTPYCLDVDRPPRWPIGGRSAAGRPRRLQ